MTRPELHAIDQTIAALYYRFRESEDETLAEAAYQFRLALRKRILSIAFRDGTDNAAETAEQRREKW